jgi:hypothetical protein
MASFLSFLSGKGKQQQQQAPQQEFMNEGMQYSSGGVIDARRILQAESDRELPPCAVIVTILQGGSYDDLYRHTPQISPDPTHTVALFELNYSVLQEVLQALRGDVSDSMNASVISDIISCMGQVDPDSVVFNFECCGSCSEEGMGGYASVIMPLVALLVQHQHIVMFGDFSLKGLIHDWSEELLGPNPFVNRGTTCSPMKLTFVPEALVDCCNAQLQNVGKMCESGEAIVKVMGGTIVFDISAQKSDTDRYATEVLTRCVNSPGGETCGHVMLTYPSGGRILVSAGHWIELSHLSGATEESVLRMCTEQMGGQKAQQMMYDLQNSASAIEREQIIQKNAQEVVWSSAPCKYSKKR